MMKQTRLLLCLLVVWSTPLSMFAQICTRTINNSGAFSPDPYDDYGCFMFQLLDDGSPNIWLFDNSSYLSEDTIQKTAVLNGEIFQFGYPNRRFTVQFNFKNRRKTLTSGTSFGTSRPDWYYYDLEGGDMSGLRDLQDANLRISANPTGYITQIGSGATQIGVNGNRFGLFSSFKWDILNQPNTTNSPKFLPFPKSQTESNNGSITILLNNSVCNTKPKPLTIACTRAIRNAKSFTLDEYDDYGALMFNLVDDASPNIWLFDKNATLSEDTTQRRAILRGGLFQLGNPKRRFDVTLELANRRDMDSPMALTNNNGWYYYDLENGRMSGADDFAGADLTLSPDIQRGAFQIGNGATLIREDETIYGLHGWFQWVVNTQPTADRVPRLKGFPDNSSVFDRGSFQVLLSDCFEKCMLYDAKNSLVDSSKINGYRPYRGKYAQKSAFYLSSGGCSQSNINCWDTFPKPFNGDPNCNNENLGENFEIPDTAHLKVRIQQQADLVGNSPNRRSVLRVAEEESGAGPIEEPIEAGVGFIKKIVNNGFIDVYDLNRNPDVSKSIVELLNKNNPSVNKQNWRYFNKIKHNIIYYLDTIPLSGKKAFPTSNPVCCRCLIGDTTACCRYHIKDTSDISIRNAINPYIQIGIGANGYHPDKLGMTVRIKYNVRVTGAKSDTTRSDTARYGGINFLLVNPRPCRLDFNEISSKSGTLNFDAKKQNNRTRLEWVKPKSLSEGDFIVQRLNDAKIFEDISTQKYDPEIGLKYFYTYDEQPTEGDNFYRLKWVGKGGDSYISAIEKVNFDIISTFGVYPNPADDVINLDLRNYKNQTITIRLYNIIGHEVGTKTMDYQDNQSVQLETHSLEAGYYFIRVSAKNKRDAVKKVAIAR